MNFLRSIEKYLRVSVLFNVMPWIFLLAAYTAGLVAIDKYVYNIEGSQLPFATSLTIVIGFLLVFRTNTGYERYMEGRRYWSTLAVQTKNLSRTIWINIQPDVSHKDGSGDISEDMIYREKVAALKNMILFLHSVMRMLRSEKDLSKVDPDYYLRDPKEDGMIFKDLSRLEKKIVRDTRILVEENIDDQVEDDPLCLHGAMIPPDPMDLLDVTSKFLARHARNPKYKTLDNALANNLEMGPLSALSDALHGCLRIVRTPLPKAYSILLHHLLAIYCLTLPLQFIDKFGWWTIAIAALVHYVFLGVYAIAVEIQNPFGKDENDLPLERFILDCELELKRLIRSSEAERRPSLALRQ